MLRYVQGAEFFSNTGNIFIDNRGPYLPKYFIQTNGTYLFDIAYAFDFFHRLNHDSGIIVESVQQCHSEFIASNTAPLISVGKALSIFIVKPEMPPLFPFGRELISA